MAEQTGKQTVDVNEDDTDRIKWRFQDRKPEEYANPELNPYLKLHREMGFPVIVAEDAPSHKGTWATAFEGRAAPLHVEIGPGNGFYLAGMAQRRPEVNWLGIEIRFKRVVLCAKKIKSAGVSNARICRYDAWFLTDLFGRGEIGGLHTNHPDPWKKARHAKHRLMGEQFVAWAADALARGAHWRIKTDCSENIQRVIDASASLPFEVVGRSNDVAREGPPWGVDDDVVTNYQTKFNKKSQPIYALELKRV